MNKFRIRDLVISLESGWCAATPERPQAAPVAAPAVPNAGQGAVACAVTAIACGGATHAQPVCQGSGHMVAEPTCPITFFMEQTCPATLARPVLTGRESEHELRVLKRQLTDALEAVTQREVALRQAIPEPETVDEIDAVIEKLETAVKELQQKRKQLKP